MTLKPCVVCGEPTPGSRCELHQRKAHPKRATTARGYDTTWSKLSKRARRMQPWCSDCGAVADLTADHSPTAWERRAAGLPIRLQDIDVVCRSCNAKRGRARPASILDNWGDAPSRGALDPARQAQTLLHTPGGYR